MAPSRPTRGAPIYLGAALISQASGLLRYVALARLLGPHELGLAAALTVTGSFFDMVTDTGSDRFLIQNPAGNAPAVQRLVQLVYLVRGFAVAAALLLGAAPIAWLYGTPRLAHGIAFLALSPAIGGLLHLDIRRAQRRHDFRGEAICTGAADLAGLAGAVIAAFALRSYLAVAWGFVLRAATLVLLSHLLARRQYRLGMDRAHAPALARFAAPLMLNGLALFLVLQGDRVIVGHALGVTELGIYTAIMLLIYYPSVVIANTVHGLFLPRIAGAAADPAARATEIALFGRVKLLLALAMETGFAVVAPIAVPLLYGRRFAEPAPLIALIGVLQATRFLLGWPSTTALALGRSVTVLLANLFHILIIPGAALGLWLVGGLPGAVLGFVAAELLACAAALVLMNRNSGAPRREGFGALGLLVLNSCGLEIYALAAGAGRIAAAAAVLAALLLLLAFLAARDAALTKLLAGLARRRLR